MKKSSWIKLGLFIILLVFIFLILRWLGLDFNQIKPERIKNYVKSFGIWAPAIYILIYAQPIVPIPAGIVTIAGGLAFGPWWGFLAVLVGATIRACLEFLIARHLGRDAVGQLFKGKLARLDQMLGENSFQAVFLIRLIPNLPFDIQNFGLGLSKVDFLPYFLATIVGMIPGTFAFVFLGYSLSDPKHLWKLGIAVLVIIVLISAQKFFKKKKNNYAKK
jgi:uncharacterized membrane protein YdjX (TVP38/TMEM64 family)